MLQQTKVFVMFQLWLDDIHSHKASAVPLEHPIWVVNGNDFIDTIDLMISDGSAEKIDLISFDNDLGDEAAISGVDCFNYVECLLHEGHLSQLRTIIVHSDNSSAVNTFMSAVDIFKERYNIVIMRKRRVT